jgi:hypothetical protein
MIMAKRLSRLNPAVAAITGLMAFGTPLVHADQVAFGFSGFGFSGSGTLTIQPNVAPADPNPNCGTAGNNPCRTDPPGAFAITAISGRFSDAGRGISNAAITGLVPINPANEKDVIFDPLVPSSLSFIPAAGAENDALSYNNLFFPNGSPIDCAFPFMGTFVDVFGMAFTIEGGLTIDLWGDGDLHGPGTRTYGIGVSDGTNLLAYQFDGIDATIPEPGSLALFGIGILGMMLASRKRATVA